MIRRRIYKYLELICDKPGCGAELGQTLRDDDENTLFGDDDIDTIIDLAEAYDWQVIAKPKTHQHLVRSRRDVKNAYCPKHWLNSTAKDIITDLVAKEKK